MSDVQSVGVVGYYTMANWANSSDLRLTLADFGAHRLKELVTFYVRHGDADQSLFESAYTDFIEYVSFPFPTWITILSDLYTEPGSMFVAP